MDDFYIDFYNKGDHLVCITKNMPSFTYGKKYEILSETVKYPTLIDIMNDNGQRSLPSLYYTDKGVKKYYFITINEWRQKQLEKIFKKSR